MMNDGGCDACNPFLGALAGCRRENIIGQRQVRYIFLLGLYFAASYIIIIIGSLGSSDYCAI